MRPMPHTISSLLSIGGQIQLIEEHKSRHLFIGIYCIGIKQKFLIGYIYIYIYIMSTGNWRFLTIISPPPHLLYVEFEISTYIKICVPVSNLLLEEQGCTCTVAACWSCQLLALSCLSDPWLLQVLTLKETYKSDIFITFFTDTTWLTKYMCAPQNMALPKADFAILLGLKFHFFGS